MTPDEVRIREGLSSYQSQTNQTTLDMSHSHSINTIPSVRDYIISEDLLQGQRLHGRMSNVRRFFCLFVTFDFLFISLMWLICVMLDGKYIIDALKAQILHYNIHTSLFDIVAVAFSRFFVLILFYGICYINHWIIISLSTALSCAFLIVKVFMFDWPKSTQPIFEVLLILVSFILSWGEAWFLDFRVIPQETNADRYLITNAEAERAPLIRSYVQGLPSMYTESVGNFYSPMATPEGSHRSVMVRDLDELVIEAAVLTQEQEDQYRLLGAQTLQSAWDLYQKNDWKLEKKRDVDCVYSRKDPKAGTVFKLEVIISASPRYLFDELYFRVDNLAKWNTSVKDSYKVQTVDEYTDITYQISEDAAGGLVSSRDFVNLRHWALIEDTYVMCCVKCDHPKLPPGNKYVRAENGIGGYVIESIPDGPDKCRFIWMVNPNLNIKVPKFILDRELVNMMFVFAKDLRDHLKKEETR
ncbi:steroidogenic acute regulatory protein-like [Anthonomus grandis grandis]|uniref:steroidogenic acute regulatory protein-like n=1 Tax=Anthonomus grandis grandis TaxID=2921223 RepID=UPI002166A1C3|nr:steroidogenic acute regulatory protein-like [Anthonomus grandis grandis]